jgi:hypothetical protein
MRTNTLFLLLSTVFFLPLLHCASAPAYVVSKKLSKQNYPRVGILVSRMGSLYPGDLARISPGIDYARRRPRKPNYWGLDEEKLNVLIENDQRIKESIPTYPLYRNRTRINENAQFYRNISQPLYGMLKSIFQGKGYEVVNLRELAKNWQPLYSELRIEEIIKKAQPDMDALLVMHYIGMKDHSYRYHLGSVEQTGNTKVVSRTTVSGRCAGFFKLFYSVAMFDAATRELLLSVHVDDGIQVRGPQDRKSPESILAALIKTIRKTGPKAYAITLLKQTTELLPGSNNLGIPGLESIVP